MAEKILIVDDDFDTLRLVGLMLERQGYAIIAAENGQQALQSMKREKPNLVLLDVMMPGMDGYEVARRIRADEETSDIPIIMFTAKTQVEDKVTGLESGVDVALGPCDDGGYYLIGLKRPVPSLLRGVQMSTPTVAEDTIALALEENLRVHLLPTWYDVDDAASLIQLAEEVEDGDQQVANHTRRFITQLTSDGWLRREV